MDQMAQKLRKSSIQLPVGLKKLKELMPMLNQLPREEKEL
jgi:hypothetical protein